MTTPSAVCPPPLPSTPPLPAGPGRARRAWIAGAVGVLLVALLAGAIWWLTRDADNSPLAGRPRVTDSAAGLSYAVPQGWKRSDGKDLIKAFTSSITTSGPDGHGGAAVLAGRGGAVEESTLRRRTETAARSNAEFFYPDATSTVEESRPTTVSGHPAYTVSLSARDDGGRAGRIRLTIVAQGAEQSAFLLGVSESLDPAMTREIDAVLADAAMR